jgi:translation initiation factor IF-2
MIIGCRVVSGLVEKKAKLKVKRGEEIVGEIHIQSLQRNQESANEVKEGQDCGLKISGNMKIEEGDVLIPYKMEKKIRTL